MHTLKCIIESMDDKKFFILSTFFLGAILFTAVTDYDLISMGLSFAAMGVCFWYIKNRNPKK